jgi:hypothetical protein
MTKKISNYKGKKSGYVALAMAAILLSAVFTAAIPSSAAQLPPGPPNPPVDVTETSSLRVYGEGDLGPDESYGPKGQMIYDNWSDPFDPTVLQKDSITFNPAIILWDGQESAMSAGSDNIHEKKFLRIWYEPQHVYTKPEYCHPTIEVESTYMLIDRQDWIPTSGRENVTYFKFPIVEIPGQTGVGAFENNLSEVEPLRANVVRLALVKPNAKVSLYNKTTNGTIRIQKTYTMDPGETVQFLDFKLQYKYIVVKDKTHYVKVKMWYAGNYEDDTEVLTVLGQYDDGSPDAANADTFFKRHMERYPTSSHSYADLRTWYACFEDEIVSGVGSKVEITVGKEISASDTFYVNGVRYDVPAIEVVNKTDDLGVPGYEFKYITLRTPLPKCPDLAPGEFGEVLDDGKISSQWIVCVPPSTALPLNPPFNQLDGYKMVDDINVVLWEPLKHTDQWPVGDPSGNPGTEYFPLAERYLTMQNPPIPWLTYFKAIPIDTDGDMNPPMPNDPQIWLGPYDPANLTVQQLEKWIAYDLDERMVDVYKPLQVVYIDETEEPRYSTDLLEILNETLYYNKEPYENWTKFDIQTLPDRYTEFVLPELPDVETPYWSKTGDYLVTTSLLAPNSETTDTNFIDPTENLPRVAFAYDVDYEETPYLDRVEWLGNGLDIYVNMWGSSSSIRIYGETDCGPVIGYDTRGRALPYPYWQDPFDPTTLEKDSITFNPIIWEWDGNEYPMSADSIDIDEKIFLRTWYEPEHKYSKNKIWDNDRNYTRPTIELETTYMLIDKQEKRPISGKANYTFLVFPIAEDESTEDIPGLELLENPNSEADRPNVVTLALVNGTVNNAYNKTANGTIRLQKTYKLDMGDKVQFLDHKLTFVGIVVHNDCYYAKVKVDYAGNRVDDTGATVVLATYDDGSTYDSDPHAITWFKRHSETYDTVNMRHPDITWYARLENYDPSYDWAEITVGKELKFNDTFYVDGVRYDIPAIEVIDTSNDITADAFKYITLRTPYPKCIATGTPEVPDDGIISSQWIVCVPPYVPLPLLPPFNMDHTLIDDIDVVLWEPLKMPPGATWPCGNPSGNLGTEYFPLAERYLTMQYPPAAWLTYFRAVPIDTDNDISYPVIPNDPQLWAGPYYPGNVTAQVSGCWEVGVCGKTMPVPTPGNFTIFDKDHWIALDVNERIIAEPYNPLEVIYVEELIEPRYSTNLLEILNEPGEGTMYLKENWTKYDIQTLPDQYTEFVLPKDEAHADEPLMNDYLITSSFLAPNANGDLIGTLSSLNRFAFVFDAFDSLEKTGLYVNELVTEPPPPNNSAPILVIDADPTSVNALETVTVDTAGTYDDPDSYPLKITCDWGDGKVDTAMYDEFDPAAPVFTHEYTSSDPYTVTVTAKDIYGAEDTKTALVAVLNDGAVLQFSYGWNAISAPVQNGTSMSGLFWGNVPGFYAVYSWNNSEQGWQTEDLSQPLDPAKGYFVWATGDAEVPITGTAVPFDLSWISGSEWNLVGAGSEGYELTSTYAYWYDHPAGYVPTHDMDPGKGYFVYV